jgi:hypothetical protein
VSDAPKKADRFRVRAAAREQRMNTIIGLWYNEATDTRIQVTVRGELTIFRPDKVETVPGSYSFHQVKHNADTKGYSPIVADPHMPGGRVNWSHMWEAYGEPVQGGYTPRTQAQIDEYVTGAVARIEARMAELGLA